jgi:hypothetical protein
MAALEMRSIETDKITIVVERSSESLPAALVPSVHHLLVEGSNGRLVSGHCGGLMALPFD